MILGENEARAKVSAWFLIYIYIYVYVDETVITLDQRHRGNIETNWAIYLYKIQARGGAFFSMLSD